MQIVIGFENPNTGADSINVYRSTDLMNPNALPAVYEVISGNANSYSDSNVVRGAQYYYIFETVKGAAKVRTGNIPAAAQVYNGPGPNAFKYGDMNSGYFGLVNASDFMSWENALIWSGITWSAKTTVTDQYWLKFAHKGKILFVASQPLGWVSGSWNALYAQGLIYGTDDSGPRDINIQPEVNQLRTINIAGNLYKCRVMKCLPDGMSLPDATVITANQTPVDNITLGGNAYGKASMYDTLIDTSGSEWDDLILPLLSWTPFSQKCQNWDPLDTQLAFAGAAAFTGLTASSQHFQELTMSGTTRCFISRGNWYNNRSFHPGLMSGTQNVASNGIYWRPVFEMIP